VKLQYKKRNLSLYVCGTEDPLACSENATWLKCVDSTCTYKDASGSTQDTKSSRSKKADIDEAGPYSGSSWSCWSLSHFPRT